MARTEPKPEEQPKTLAAVDQEDPAGQEALFRADLAAVTERRAELAG